MFEFDMRAVRQLITDLLRTLFGEQAQVIETLIRRLVREQAHAMEETARRLAEQAISEQARVFLGIIGCFVLFVIITLIAGTITYRRIRHINQTLNSLKRELTRTGRA